MCGVERAGGSCPCEVGEMRGVEKVDVGVDYWLFLAVVHLVGLIAR